jgi:hypothetical protein
VLVKDEEDPGTFHYGGDDVSRDGHALLAGQALELFAAEAV